MSAQADLLKDLASAGTHESEGAFTLDLSRARERFRSYLLEDRHAYLGLLVQSAVLGDARSMWCDRFGDDLSIRHDGLAPTSQQLANLLDHILPGEWDVEDAHLRPLALAVNALLERHVIELNCSVGSGWVSLTASSRQADIRSFNPERDGSARSVVEAPARGVTLTFKSKRPFFALDDPERRALRTTARFAPVHLAGNLAPRDVPFGEPRDGGEPNLSNRRTGKLESINGAHHALEVRFKGNSLADGLIDLPPTSASFMFTADWHASERITGMVESTGRCQAVLALRADLATPPCVHLVHHGGVVAELTRRDFPQAIMMGIAGVVAVDRHASDLTGCRLQVSALTTVKREVVENVHRLHDLLERRWDAGLGADDRVAYLLSGHRNSRLYLNGLWSGGR